MCGRSQPEVGVAKRCRTSKMATAARAFEQMIENSDGSPMNNFVFARAKEAALGSLTKSTGPRTLPPVVYVTPGEEERRAVPPSSKSSAQLHLPPVAVRKGLPQTRSLASLGHSHAGTIANLGHASEFARRDNPFAAQGGDSREAAYGSPAGVDTLLEQRRATDRLRHRAMAPATKKLPCDLNIGERVCAP